MNAIGLNVLAGAGFGAALALAQVHIPFVITKQMQWLDFHMVQVFLAATAASSLVMLALERVGLFKPSPRTPSTVGWFSKYDANVIGGLMVGMGMTLSGSCPGTLMVQVGTLARSSLVILVGAIAGGIVFARVGPLLKKQPRRVEHSQPAPLTIQDHLGWKASTAIIAWQATCWSLVILAGLFAPRAFSPNLHPILGGLLIGTAQAFSILLLGRTLGVSGAYGEIGELFWRIWDPYTGLLSEKTSPLSTRATLYAVGMILGSFALLKSFPSRSLLPVEADPVSDTAGLVGGFLLAFGARLAGGCTSGHGVSGMAMLSLSSFITVAAMFGGGMLLAQMLK